jgi:hypothetical protein
MSDRDNMQADVSMGYVLREFLNLLDYCWYVFTFINFVLNFKTNMKLA